MPFGKDLSPDRQFLVKIKFVPRLSPMPFGKDLSPDYRHTEMC